MYKYLRCKRPTPNVDSTTGIRKEPTYETLWTKWFRLEPEDTISRTFLTVRETKADVDVVKRLTFYTGNTKLDIKELDMLYEVIDDVEQTTSYRCIGVHQWTTQMVVLLEMVEE